MDDIDARLNDAGATWRASQPAFDESAALSGLSKRSARAAPRLRLIKSAVFVLIVGLIGVALVGRAWSDERVGADVTVGDRVEGAGSVIVSRPQVAQLCLPGFGRLVPGQTPTCSSVRVHLVELDPETLPGRQVVGDVIFSRWVSIIGSWNGEALVVESVEASDPPNETLEASPCRPAADPSQTDATPLTIEDETGRIGDVVSTDPDLYAGYWSARDSTLDASAPPVLVVATVGDPVVVRAGLKAATWLPLCVVHVMFSSRELLSWADELRLGHPDWSIDVNHRMNRVRVKLAVVTPEIRTELTELPAVFLDPLVRPIGE